MTFKNEMSGDKILRVGKARCMGTGLDEGQIFVVDIQKIRAFTVITRQMRMGITDVFR